MRDRLVYALLSSALLACGGGGMAADNGGDDAPPTPDAGDPPPPARGFQLVSPDVEIGVGQEITYCYYFRTPNTEPMAIKKWTSSMTPGSHHLILFTTGTTDKQAPGTISEVNCGFGGISTNPPAWTYSAQTPDAELVLPADDGTGKPLAMEIPPNTAGFIQMHYFNATDQPIQAHVTINAEALPADTAFTKTAAFVTYNASIDIPYPSTEHVESMTCEVPAGAKFWLMSTHAHRHAILTEVLDGETMAMSSTDWEHPVPETWMATPFFTFQTGNVTYRCTYNNNSSDVNERYDIKSGDSAQTDEMCMASGYYFLADSATTKPRICINNFLIQ